MSKKVTLSADGASATVAEASFSDIFTTALSSDTAVTGTYKFAQTGLLVLAGMMVQNVRLGQGVNVFRG